MAGRGERGRSRAWSLLRNLESGIGSFLDLSGTAIFLGSFFMAPQCCAWASMGERYTESSSIKIQASLVVVALLGSFYVPMHLHI